MKVSALAGKPDVWLTPSDLEKNLRWGYSYSKDVAVLHCLAMEHLLEGDETVAGQSFFAVNENLSPADVKNMMKEELDARGVILLRFLLFTHSI